MFHWGFLHFFRFLIWSIHVINILKQERLFKTTSNIEYWKPFTLIYCPVFYYNLHPLVFWQTNRLKKVIYFSNISVNFYWKIQIFNQVETFKFKELLSVSKLLLSSIYCQQALPARSLSKSTYVQVTRFF